MNNKAFRIIASVVIVVIIGTFAWYFSKVTTQIALEDIQVDILIQNTFSKLLKGSYTKELPKDPEAGSGTIVTPPSTGEGGSACSTDTWLCGAWGTCVDNKQTRDCKMTFDCPGAASPQPSTSQTCTVSTPSCTEDKWTCGEWGQCSKEGIQLRTCALTNDCPSVNTPKPNEQEQCTPIVLSDEGKIPDGKEGEVPIVPPTTAEIEDALEKFEDIQGEDEFTDNYNEQPSGHSTGYALNDNDGDGLTADEETAIGTDNNSFDSDQDGIADSIDPNSTVIDDLAEIDQNNNGLPDDVDDRVQDTYQITIADGNQDTDGDGISDTYEVIIGTDPTVNDSDGDGIPDGEEVLDYGSNPTDANSNPTDSDMIAIVNVGNGNNVPDDDLTITGAAPAGTPLELVATDVNGNRFVIGRTVATENHKFVFVAEKKMPEGSFLFSVEGHNQKSQTLVLNVIDKKQIESVLKTPIVQKLEDKLITPEVLLSKIELTNVLQPTAYGVTTLGTHTVGNWYSALFSAAIIADAKGGLFEITSPQKLDVGDHEVTVYAKNPSYGTISPSVTVPFTITEKGEIIPRGAAKTDGTKPNIPWGIVGVVAGIVVVLIAIGVITGRKKP